MSRKQVYGVTLTPEERHMAGYDRTSSLRQTTVSMPVAPPQSDGIAFHACQVRLPDDTDCQADYTRYGSGSHVFCFHSPLSERIHGQGIIDHKEAIEARAQEVAGKAWRQAQQAEQRGMRLASAPPHLTHTIESEPPLQRKTAQRFAGLYAVCLRYASGTLTPLSLAYERPAAALAALTQMQAEDHRTLVVGICCRWGRRWQEPRFLADANDEPDPDEQSEAEDT